MPYVVICSMQAKPGNHRLALSSLKSTRLATVTHYSYHGVPGSYLHGPEISRNPWRKRASSSLAYSVVG